jgi:hypothetical protein
MTADMIKDLYKSRGYIPSKKTMKKAKKAAEEKPRGLMSRAKEDK